MRWMWIDQILELETGSRCVALKNISMAEEHLHDHFPRTETRPARPIMPAPLIIEGVAQTAGILVGHARGFKEKVLLAKIGRAEFDHDATPGQTLIYEATIDRIDDAGASTSGTVYRIDRKRGSEREMFGRVDLMFSHVDQSMVGMDFPDHNFVFTDQFYDLLRNSGFETRI